MGPSHEQWMDVVSLCPWPSPLPVPVCPSLGPPACAPSPLPLPVPLLAPGPALLSLPVPLYWPPCLRPCPPRPGLTIRSQQAKRNGYEHWLLVCLPGRGLHHLLGRDGVGLGSGVVAGGDVQVGCPGLAVPARGGGRGHMLRCSRVARPAVFRHCYCYCYCYKAGPAAPAPGLGLLLLLLLVGWAYCSCY